MTIVAQKPELPPATVLVQDYLIDIGKLLEIPSDQLRLFRYDDNRPDWKVDLSDPPNDYYVAPSPHPAGFWEVRGKRVIGGLIRFRLSSFPGCCAFTVSHQAWVAPHVRRKGLQQRSHQLREDISRLHGYTAMICTDVITNAPQCHILRKRNWREIFQIHNTRTRKDVGMWVKVL